MPFYHICLHQWWLADSVRLVLRTAITPPVWRRAPPVARRAHRICHWQRT